SDSRAPVLDPTPICSVSVKLIAFLVASSIVMIKTLRLSLACCLLAVPLFAQIPTDSPVDALRHPGWNKGVFLGGSQSFATTPSAQTFLFGARVGRVLTHEIGHNPLRGTFEMAIDVIP